MSRTSQQASSQSATACPVCTEELSSCRCSRSARNRARSPAGATAPVPPHVASQSTATQGAQAPRPDAASQGRVSTTANEVDVDDDYDGSSSSDSEDSAESHQGRRVKVAKSVRLHPAYKLFLLHARPIRGYYAIDEPEVYLCPWQWIAFILVSGACATDIIIGDRGEGVIAKNFREAIKHAFGDVPLTHLYNTSPNNITKETYTLHFDVDQFTQKVQVTNNTYEYNDKGYPVKVNGEVEYVYK